MSGGRNLGKPGRNQTPGSHPTAGRLLLTYGASRVKYCICQVSDEAASHLSAAIEYLIRLDDPAWSAEWDLLVTMFPDSA